MSQRVKVRRLSDEEGRQLQRIVRRGGGKSEVMRYRRAMVVLASAGGNTVEVIARLVQTSPDQAREMIHRFNDMGMKSLDPQWAGGNRLGRTSSMTGSPLSAVPSSTLAGSDEGNHATVGAAILG